MDKSDDKVDLGEAGYYESTALKETKSKKAIDDDSFWDSWDKDDELDETWKIASKIQIGGDHYTKLEIQPMTYSMANKLNALQHTALKYITRYPDKGTPLQDLAKARHCIDMMIEDWMDNHYEEDL